VPHVIYLEALGEEKIRRKTVMKSACKKEHKKGGTSYWVSAVFGEERLCGPAPCSGCCGPAEVVIVMLVGEVAEETK
jgi:hypothetical protein